MSFFFFFAQESLDNRCLIISVCALYFNFSNISSYSQSLIIIQSTLTKIFWKPLFPLTGVKQWAFHCLLHAFHIWFCISTAASSYICRVPFNGMANIKSQIRTTYEDSAPRHCHSSECEIPWRQRPSKPIMFICILPFFLRITASCLTGFMKSDASCVSPQKTRYFFTESSWLKTVNKTWSM